MMSRVAIRRILFFVGAFAFALIATFPLRVAVGASGLAEHGFAAREARGSLWSGRLNDLIWGPIRFGDVAAGAGLPQLLIGRLSLGLADGRGARATMFAGASGAGVSGAHAALQTGNLFAPMPLSAFELEDVSVRFGPRGCSAASGFVRARGAGAIVDTIVLPPLGGAPRCENGMLLLSLASSSGRESVELRLGRARSYEAAVTLQTADPLAAERLKAAGFRRNARGYRAVTSGSLSGQRR